MQNNVVGGAFGITDSGRVRIVQLQQVKVEEELASDLTKGVSGWTRSGAIGAWVAAGLTLIAIIITLYLGCNPFRSNEYYSKGMDSIARAKFQHEMDSMVRLSHIQNTDSSGAVLDSEISKRLKPKTRLMRKTIRLDPLSHEKRIDTLNINNLPALQKEIDKNTKDSIKGKR
jgi:hypothetical protein